LTKTVGVVGVGVMGSAFAANLTKGGFRVVGYDPSPAARELLASLGATCASSVTEVAERCDTVLLSLPNAKALEAVAGAESGLAAASVSGLIAIECSTLSIEAKSAARDALATSGVTLLDCPVSGTGAQALIGDLVAFCSGDEAAYAAARPVLQGFTRAQFFLGDFGMGSAMKFIANHLVAIHNVAAAEAIVLGMKAGLDPSLVYETIANSAATSRMFEVRGPLMRDERYEPPSVTLRTFLKDVSIISEFAGELRCPTPLFAAAAEVYLAAAAQGREMQDTASVCAVLEQAAGAPRRSEY
jgi:L-threonate 2-dehydrogenase